MVKPKIYKILTAIAAGGMITAGVLYASLTNRHKAIVKTVVLHKTRLIPHQWAVAESANTYRMISPAFLIDGIYKSMEGPKASKYVQLSQDSTVVWITGFKVKALDSRSEAPMSNDFICHTNIDINDVRYYGNFGLESRIGKQYPRLTSLSHGLETFRFPKGYGVPIKGNDLLFVTTESLNHNLSDKNYLIKHEVAIEYNRTKNIRPLMSRTVFIQLPYDKSDPYKGPLDPGSDVCMPVETRNHSYDDGNGNMMSGHWVVPTGKSTYRSSVNTHLQITDSLRLHAAAIHVHPYAVRIMLWDQTKKAAVFISNITNHRDRTGLSKVEDFVSEDGVWLYENHDYELVLDVVNTSNQEQDMMGSMFLFFYDSELESYLLKNKIL